MKILLDECVTRKLKAHLQKHVVFTVTEMNWSGLKNGNLLRAAVENDFAVLVTIDKNILYQQNINAYPISVVVLNVRTSMIDELLLFLEPLELQLYNLEKGKSYLINR